MSNNENSTTTLMPMNVMNIRRWCLERTLELVKSEGPINGKWFCDSQDMKCQVVDCAKALADFLLDGRTTESNVGKTPLLLSASRLLGARGVTISVAVLTDLMTKQGFISKNAWGHPTFTAKGETYGRNKPRPGAMGSDVPIPYYYDDRFDELLEILGLQKENKGAITKNKKSK